MTAVINVGSMTELLRNELDNDDYMYMVDASKVSDPDNGRRKVKASTLQVDWDLTTGPLSILNRPTLGTMSAVDDAPSDTNIYGRQNGSWVEVAQDFDFDGGKALISTPTSMVETDHVPLLYVDWQSTGVEPAHVEGRQHWNFEEGVPEFDLFTGSTWQGSVEDLTLVYNDSTTETVPANRAVYLKESGGDATLSRGLQPTFGYADAGASYPSFAARDYAGVTTADIPPESYGFICRGGKSRMFDSSAVPDNTDMYVASSLEGGTPGMLTPVRPRLPSSQIRVGKAYLQDGNGYLHIDDQDISFANSLASANIAKERTGFQLLNGVAVDSLNNPLTLNANPATRTFSIGFTGSFSFFQGDNRNTITDPQEIVWPDVEGDHFIYYNTSGVLSHSNSFSPSYILGLDALVSYFYWDAANQEIILDHPFIELHGLAMPGASHYHLHQVLGSQIYSGLGLGGFNIGNGTLDSHAQWGFEAGVFADEDLWFSPTAVASTTGVKVLYLLGSNTLRQGSHPGFSVLTDIDLGIGATGRPAHNVYNDISGEWEVAVVPLNSYFLMHSFVVGTAGSTKQFVVMGQNTYVNNLDAQEGAQVELGSLVGLLPFQEIRPLGTVILQAGTYTNSVKCRVIPTDDGGYYIDYRKDAVPGGTSIMINTHNSLSGRSEAACHPASSITYGLTSVAAHLDGLSLADLTNWADDTLTIPGSIKLVDHILERVSTSQIAHKSANATTAGVMWENSADANLAGILTYSNRIDFLDSSFTAMARFDINNLYLPGSRDISMTGGDISGGLDASFAGNITAGFGLEVSGFYYNQRPFILTGDDAIDYCELGSFGSGDRGGFLRLKDNFNVAGVFLDARNDTTTRHSYINGGGAFVVGGSAPVSTERFTVYGASRFTGGITLTDGATFLKYGGGTAADEEIARFGTATNRYGFLTAKAFAVSPGYEFRYDSFVEGNGTQWSWYDDGVKLFSIDASAIDMNSDINTNGGDLNLAGGDILAAASIYATSSIQVSNGTGIANMTASGDVWADRGNNTATYYFTATGTRYLYYSASGFTLGGGNLSISGYEFTTAGGDIRTVGGDIFTLGGTLNLGDGTILTKGYADVPAIALYTDSYDYSALTYFYDTTDTLKMTMGFKVDTTDFRITDQYGGLLFKVSYIGMEAKDQIALNGNSPRLVITDSLGSLERYCGISLVTGFGTWKIDHGTLGSTTDAALNFITTNGDVILKLDRGTAGSPGPASLYADLALGSAKSLTWVTGTGRISAPTALSLRAGAGYYHEFQVGGVTKGQLSETTLNLFTDITTNGGDITAGAGDISSGTLNVSGLSIFYDNTRLTDRTIAIQAPSSLSNPFNAGSIELTERTVSGYAAFGAPSTYGFRVRYGGDDNTFHIERGENAVISDCLTIARSNGGVTVFSDFYTNGNDILTNGGDLTLGAGTANVGLLSVQSSANIAAIYNNATGTYSSWQYNGTTVGDVGTGNQLVSGGSTADFGITSRAGNLLLGAGSVTKVTVSASAVTLSSGVDLNTSGGDINLAGGDVRNATYLSFTGTGFISHVAQDSSVKVFGGTTGGVDPGIQLFGSTHATLAGRAYYDANQHTFRTATYGALYDVTPSAFSLSVDLSTNGNDIGLNGGDVNSVGAITGSTGAQTLVKHGSTSGLLNLSGGSTGSGTDANIAMYGASHATLAKNILLDGDLIKFRTTGYTTMGSWSTAGLVLSTPLQLNNAFVSGAPTATGYIVIKDSAGTSYKILCAPL